MYILEGTAELLKSYGMRQGDVLMAARASDGGLLMAARKGGQVRRIWAQPAWLEICKGSGPGLARVDRRIVAPLHIRTRTLVPPAAAQALPISGADHAAAHHTQRAACRVWLHPPARSLYPTAAAGCAAAPSGGAAGER